MTVIIVSTVDLFDLDLRILLSVSGFLVITGLALILVWIISMVNEKGISVREVIDRQTIVIRWTVWLAMLLFIIVFGAYGLGYIPVDPMYAQF